MKYESSILKRLIDVYGVVGNPRYISEIIKQFIVQGKECYPNLFTYQSDWLAHIDEFGLTPEYTVSYTGQHIYAPNTKEKPVKRAILSGSTKYRDIDTGEFLETFEEGRNLELVSVKMPVLKTTNNKYTFSDFEIVPNSDDGVVNETYKDDRSVTLKATNRWARIRYNVKHDNNVSYNLKFDYNATKSFVIDFNGYQSSRTSINSGTGSFSYDFIAKNNEIIHFAFPEGGTVEITNIEFGLAELKDEPYKTNILTVNEDVTLRSNGSVCDELDLLTGKLTQRIDEDGEILTQEVVKTVDLSVKDQDNQVINQLSTFEGGTHFTTSSQDGSLLPTITVDVVTDLEETLMVCSIEGNTM